MTFFEYIYSHVRHYAACTNQDFEDVLLDALYQILELFPSLADVMFYDMTEFKSLSLKVQFFCIVTYFCSLNE